MALFSIFPIHDMNNIIEIETSDPSVALQRIDADRLGEVDVFQDGVYSFSCQPLYDEAWRIFGRRMG
ncbi:hypothetical protein [Novosphingobium kaempferiae]|uniref:hypothetical protein n=1 Tax=Novosphingobium kaempferiae TaxID=2896849 RepID=UPI001E4803A5|nr:hypothetical protein [Novosphingobium kaempferiae]